MSLVHRALPSVEDALKIIESDREKRLGLAKLLIVRNLIEGGFLAGQVRGLVPVEPEPT